ncbi:MAG: hypothetical protein ACR2NO_03085 [Chloroflexota bacterium]
MNLLDLARSALTDTPDTPRVATPAEAAELRRLLDILLADVPEQIEWSLAIACADPDAALMSFRALVADMRDRGMHAPFPDIPR